MRRADVWAIEQAENGGEFREVFSTIDAKIARAEFEMLERRGIELKLWKGDELILHLGKRR